MGRIAVRFAGTGAEPAVAAVMSRIHAQRVAPPSSKGWVSVAIPDNANPVVVAAELQRTRGVVEAKALLARYLTVVPNDNDFGPAPPYGAPQTNPVQWDMYLTQMPAAWGITVGLSTVKIAMIDTGYDSHNADICSKVVNSAVFDLGAGAEDTSATAQDKDGHGSNTSGIAAASTNNVTRFAGVGWNIDLLEVRVFPYGPNPSASSTDVAAGINWAVAHGAKVVSMSLGAPGPCDTGPGSEGQAISDANAAGVVVVVSSGNDGASTISSPASCTGAVAVGASAIDDVTVPSAPTETVAGYSNYGAGLALVAPGGDPCVARPPSCTPTVPSDYLQWIINNYSTTASPGGTGVLIAGTSMAAPHVAGAVALMFSKNGTLTPAKVKTILTSSVDVLSGVLAAKQGAGRLNVDTALTMTP